MKKLVILLFLAVSTLLYGQSNSPLNYIYIPFDMSTITGTDTVLFYISNSGTQKINGFGSRIGIEIEYKSMDASDATFSFGVSNSGYTFNKYDSATYFVPYTLDPADSALVNGSIRTSSANYKASKSWNLPSNPFQWIPLKITPNSVTSGTLYIWIYQLREE